MNIQQLCRMIAPAWVIACVATVSLAGPAAEVVPSVALPAGPAAPYLLKQHFVLWGSAMARLSPGNAAELDTRGAAARLELANRLPTTPYGAFPYPLETRFIDMANMASGFGGTGTFKTHPNDLGDGYLDADYDAWYTADLWDMLTQEVLIPIGIHQAASVRTREPGGRDGFIWANAGYYPTLDDLATIELLYQRGGAHQGRQLLHRLLTLDLLAAEAKDPGS